MQTPYNIKVEAYKRLSLYDTNEMAIEKNNILIQKINTEKEELLKSIKLVFEGANIYIKDLDSKIELLRKEEEIKKAMIDINNQDNINKYFEIQVKKKQTIPVFEFEVDEEQVQIKYFEFFKWLLVNLPYYKEINDEKDNLFTIPEIFKKIILTDNRPNIDLQIYLRKRNIHIVPSGDKIYYQILI